MLLTAQHCRPPAASCLGRQPGTASRPSCMRTGQRKCKRQVLARAVPPGDMAGSSMDQPPALSSWEERQRLEKEQEKYEKQRAAAEAETLAAEAEARAIVAPDGPASAWQAGSGGYETSWYAWPEGYLGQSFNLSGKLQPRASALRDDVNVLSQWSTTRREEAQFSEHTVTSAEESSLMVSAVVGADVDMGLLKVGGSASFEMYQNYKASCISHNMVASFQQNQMLERNQMALSLEAMKVLKRMGPKEFQARYGTHFVCGIGYRGAFVGSINIRTQDSSDSYAAGAAFKASYGMCSGTADIKAKMTAANIDCEVKVEWSKWGADDDGTLDELEENCSADEPSLTAIRQLAIQTADRATGYPKLIKLRPYSTLPDYVEACNESGRPLPQLLDQEPVLAYLTDRYRRVAYVMAALQQERRPGVGASSSTSLEAQTRLLIGELEDAFTNKEKLSNLGAYFKELVPAPAWAYPPEGRFDDVALTSAIAEGQQLVQGWDRRVFTLDYQLFKHIHRPLALAKPRVARLFDFNAPGGGEADGRDGAESVHIAAVSDSSASSPSGGWFLNYQQQEVFSSPGFYIVVLGLRDGVVQQLGSTQCFTNTVQSGKAANDFIGAVFSYQTLFNPIVLAMKVGDCSSNWFETTQIEHFRDLGGGKTESWSTKAPRNPADAELLSSGSLGLGGDISNMDRDLGAEHSWAAISYPHPQTAGTLGPRGLASMRTLCSSNMVMAEVVLKYNPLQQQQQSAGSTGGGGGDGGGGGGGDF